jgi:hypothetical protein
MDALQIWAYGVEMIARDHFDSCSVFFASRLETDSIV